MCERVLLGVSVWGGIDDNCRFQLFFMMFFFLLLKINFLLLS